MLNIEEIDYNADVTIVERSFRKKALNFPQNLMKFCRNKPPPEPLRLRSAARKEGLGGAVVVPCNDGKPVGYGVL